MKILVALEALADNSHRIDLRDINFEDFFEAQVNDEANQTFARLLEQLGEAYEIIVYTPMSETYRLQVEGWLVEHNIMADELVMKLPGDYSKNHEYSLSVINDYSDIELVIDKDIRVIEECRDNDIFVLEAA